MPEMDALVARRLGHVVHVVDEVGDERLVLHAAHRPRHVGRDACSTTYLPPGNGSIADESLDGDRRGRSPSRDPRTRSRRACCVPGQLPQHVRHADVGEHDVVPAARRLVVAIEAQQVVVQPVARRARAPRPTGRAAPRRTMPSPSALRHRDRHRVADLVAWRTSGCP